MTGPGGVRPILAFFLFILLVLTTITSSPIDIARAQQGYPVQEAPLHVGMAQSQRTLNPLSRLNDLPLTYERQKITIDDPNLYDEFGTALVASGDTLVIGGWPTTFQDGSAIYTFRRDGHSWAFQQRIAPVPGSGDAFVPRAALDGDTLVIQSTASYPKPVQVYVYVYTGSTWTLQQILNPFQGDNNQPARVSAAISGNTILIGAATSNGVSGIGYIYTRNGTTWTEQQRLTVSLPASQDRFGTPVALSGDIAVVGATGDSGSKGAAYVFTRKNGVWSQQQKLVASDPAADDQFGDQIAISDNTILVATPAKNNFEGAGYVFVRNGVTWTEQQKLTAPDRRGRRYGWSAALSGDTALIGAIGTNIGFVYTRRGTTWVEQMELTASDQGPEDSFGAPVALLGDTAFIGSLHHMNNKGAVYVFDGIPKVSTGPETIGVYRPSNSTFYLRNTNTSGVSDLVVPYGNANTYPVVGDWDNDGIDTVGAYDRTAGVFNLRNSNTSGFPDINVVLGNPGDRPLAGRWSNIVGGDGVGVFRPGNGILYLKLALTTGYADYFAVLGNPGDIGIAGDWDGDNMASPGVYRPSNSTFYLSNNASPSGIVFADTQFVFGNSCVDLSPFGCDIPVAGDWLGQCRSGVAVFRGYSHMVYMRNTLTTGDSDNTIVFGQNGDIPLAGRWAAPITTSIAPNILVPSGPSARPQGQPTPEAGFE